MNFEGGMSQEEVEMEEVEDDLSLNLRENLEEEEEGQEDGRTVEVDEDDEAAFLEFLASKQRREESGDVDEDPAAGSDDESVQADHGCTTAQVAGEQKVEKKRKSREEMEGLYAESQRLLRESRGAAFAVQPPVPRPISSVLEKIRARKMQMQEAATGSFGSSRRNFFSKPDLEILEEDQVCVLRGAEITTAEQTDGENVDQVETTVGRGANAEGEKSRKNSLDVENCARFVGEGGGVPEDPESCGEEAGALASQPCTPDDKQSERSDLVRGPVADLHTCPQRVSCSQLGSRLVREASAVKASSDDLASSRSEADVEEGRQSQEDDYDKENKKPVEKVLGEYIIARAMIDDEAEDEDDDGDGDSEEDVDEDDSDLVDLVAANVEEKPSDRRRREKLHQVWFEEQDNAATHEILQKMKTGWRRNRVASFLDEDFEMDGPGASKDAERSQRHGKQALTQAPSDLPDSTTDRKPVEDAGDQAAFVFEEEDEEEVSQEVLLHRLLQESEEPEDLLGIEGDAASNEVMGLIIKANAYNALKKKVKTGPGLGAPPGAKKKSPAKPSFLNKARAVCGQTNKKMTSRSVPSFVFGPKDVKRAEIDADDVGDKENYIPAQQGERGSGQPERLNFDRTSKPITDVWSTPSKPQAGGSLHAVLKVRAATLSSSLLVQTPVNKKGRMNGGMDIFQGLKTFKPRGFRKAM